VRGWETEREILVRGKIDGSFRAVLWGYDVEKTLSV